jgi:hypothetical protein
MQTHKLAVRAPRNPENRPLSIRVTQDEIVQIDQYASTEMRSRSALARMLFLRGLESYERELAAR